MGNHPKITIVTPNYNSGEYLEQTILSVLSQNYPNLEYIIIDGGSTDNSIDIIKRYASKLTYWTSENDNGLYHAVQKGFDKSTGEIMGWLNSDDMLHPKSLFTIGEVFSTLDDVKWLQGRPSFFDKTGRIIGVNPIQRWSKYHFYIGQYQWIQQESTFWRRTLWEQVGERVNVELKLAGDFELWLRFFQYQSLYSTSALIGGFRFRPNQLSNTNEIAYHTEVQHILKQHLISLNRKTLFKIFLFNIIHFGFRILKKIGFSAFFMEKWIISKLFDLPKIITYDKINHKFVLSNNAASKTKLYSSKL
jgi:glycosyltransferase involved in cell wall biosynthesis